MNEYSVNNYNNPKPKGFDYQGNLYSISDRGPRSDDRLL